MLAGCHEAPDLHLEEVKERVSVPGVSASMSNAFKIQECLVGTCVYVCLTSVPSMLPACHNAAELHLEDVQVCLSLVSLHA